MTTPTDKSPPREPYTIIATPKSEYDALVNERDKLQQELDAARAENYQERCKTQTKINLIEQMQFEEKNLLRQLADAKSALRCGQCGNVGMFHHGLQMQDTINELHQENETLRASLSECAGLIKIHSGENWNKIKDERDKLQQELETARAEIEQCTGCQRQEAIADALEKQLADAKAQIEDYREALDRILNEGIDTSTDGGMRFIQQTLNKWRAK